MAPLDPRITDDSAVLGRASHGGDSEWARLDTGEEGEDSRGLDVGASRSERPGDDQEGRWPS